MSICVFGDSLVCGAWDPVNAGWVTLLRNHVQVNWEKYGDLGTYNLGIYADNSSSLLSRFENELKIRTPDLTIIAIGINDSASRSPSLAPITAPVDFANNLQQLIDIGKRYAQKIVLVGLCLGDESTTQPLYDTNPPLYFSHENTKKFDQIVRQISEANHLPFISLDHTLSKPDFGTDDGLHPNTAGHRKIFQQVLPIVHKLIINSNVSTS